MKTSYALPLVALTAALATAACGGSQAPRANEARRLGMRERAIRHQAAFDFACAEEQVEVTTISSFGSRFGARGCGRRASYGWNSMVGVFMVSAVMPDTAAVAPTNSTTVASSGGQ
jgi:hypothetical protein